MILIVSHQADDHTTSVMAELQRVGHPMVLVDTGRFPSTASLTQRFAQDQESYEFSSNGCRSNLGFCRAGWWRRPQPFTLHDGIAPNAASFAYSECYEAIAGLWGALDLTWVNPPALDQVAHHKPYQLAVAKAVGLSIPRTVITNDPQVARSFIDELGPQCTVYKTFLATEECWRETRVLRPEELEIIDQVRLAPVIFQEYVPAAADLRVTVVGARMFATAISAPANGYRLDYRVDMDGATFQPTELATKTKKGIRRLMKKLGLVYGAVDLRRTEEGDVFLEINPAGEWRFIEERTDQSITRAVAELLSDLDGG